MREDRRYDGEVASTDDAHANVRSIAQARAHTYFDRKEGFVPERLALELARTHTIVYGFDGRLWRYDHGV